MRTARSFEKAMGWKYWFNMIDLF